MTAMHPSLKLLMIVSDPQIASFVAANGVDTLFVDLEWKGKAERQAHLDSWKSRHTVEDLSRIREAAPGAELLVRINPLDADSPTEIDTAVERGADCIMLPMFRTSDEACRFIDLVADRAKPVLLFETAGSLEALPDILRRRRFARAHIGLNDLHLDLGMGFMFEPLTEGLLEEPTALFRASGVAFGMGGLARLGEGQIDSELLLSEHIRLGSEWAILSRTFHRQASNLAELTRTTCFAGEVAKLKNCYAQLTEAGPELLAHRRNLAARRVRHILASAA